MKKMLFLMLFLLILGAANVTSQVRIGGNGQPNPAAVLDLNATDAINNGTKGLALPRVSLANNTALITSGTPNLSGMLVYNTSTTLGTGVYYWNGTNWLKVTNSPVGTTDIADGAVTSAKIAADAIDSTKIRNGSISLADLAPAHESSGPFLLAFGDGQWHPARPYAFGVEWTTLDSLSLMAVGDGKGVILTIPTEPSWARGKHCWIDPRLSFDYDARLNRDAWMTVIRINSVWGSAGIGAFVTCLYW